MPILTRQQAAAELVDGAIAAWFEGRLACAITLAGAAETGMPKLDKDATVFAMVRDAAARIGKCTEQEAASGLNASRDWLKHWGETKPDSISVDFAWAYVVRAYWHFRITYEDAEQTPNMIRLETRIREEARPIREALEDLFNLLRHIGNIIAGRPHH